MSGIKFLPGVYDDVNAAFIWYEQQTPGLGQNFIDELEDAYASIVEFPNAWPAAGRFRKFILSRFPFSIIYKDIQGHILVFAVAHHRRKPGYWHKR